jgi:hypothetical protein
MGEAWFGLVGVGVGAIVGGLAQITHVWVQAALDRAKTLRAERRQAYAAFMDAIYRFIGAWDSHFRQPTTDIEDRRSMDAVGVQVNTSLSNLEIVAPSDTYAEARKLALTVHDWWRSGEIPTLANSASPDMEESAEFLRLAKRDLGIED